MHRGNTNSKPKDYEKVLEICHQTRRPVHFILCHPAYGNCGVEDSNNESELITLPWLPLEELLERNLHRLQTQGKFVPANAIADCCQRVEAIVPMNIVRAGNDRTNHKRIEEHLVAIASPFSRGRGTRHHENRRPDTTFRYSLTKHRLIQKEYPRNDAGYSSSNRTRQNNNQNRNPRRFNGGDHRRGNQRRYDDRTNNRIGYGGEDNNEGYSNQRHQRPDQEDAPPNARRRYNDR